ncbi:MAG TPA: helix-turn-helix transcriptional regulator [Gaiellaceae bacterium]|nr:helix-turn-helix transcriptional regulator [Gaiellaceae bacterium]HZO48563.1 helix-turn-helix transcriptional regulator [Gaiellaceae bacterium]
MPRRAQWTQRPFSEEVPRLLAECGLSQRQLAAMAEVHQSHLSRLLRGSKHKTPSRDLAARVARAFGLPEEYFAEYREAVVLEHIRSDAALRDRLFRRLTR